MTSFWGVEAFTTKHTCTNSNTSTPKHSYRGIPHMHFRDRPAVYAVRLAVTLGRTDIQSEESDWCSILAESRRFLSAMQCIGREKQRRVGPNRAQSAFRNECQYALDHRASRSHHSLGGVRHVEAHKKSSQRALCDHHCRRQRRHLFRRAGCAFATLKAFES